MPTYQGGIATATASATRGVPVKTRGGVAVASGAGVRGRSAKVYYQRTVPGAVASAITGRPTKAWPGHAGVASAQAFGGVVAPIVSDADYNAAERAPERWPVWSLEVDWTDEDFTGVASDLSDCVRSIEVERAITGELPDEAGLVDGYATSHVTAVLGGERDGADMSLAEELSPFRSDSPLYGRTKVTPTARLDLGLLTDRGPKTYRQLTGPVRSLKIREGEQRVELDAVDPSERIREAITLPTYAEFVTHAARRPWSLTVNTQWVVDFILRANGIYASPPPRKDAIISCTGHGGLSAEVGFSGAPISLYGTGPQAGLWTEDDHPWGMLGTPENSSGGTVGYMEQYGVTDGRTAPFRFEAGNGVGLSCWLHMGSYMRLGSSFENRLFQIRPGDILNDNAQNEYPRLFVSGFGNGDIYAGLTPAAGQVYGTPRIPTGPERWRFFGVHFRYASATSLVVTIRLDKTTRTYTLTVPATSPARGYRPVLQVNTQMFRAWTNFQTWVSPTAPTLAEWQAGENHVSEADIARGINELLYLPDVAAEDSWEVLKAAVGAEFGVHGFTEAGRYFFRPRTDERSPDIDVDISVDDNLETVGYELSSDSVRNVIGYSSTPRYHSGKFQTVVKAEDALQFICPPGVKTFEIDWPWGAAGRHGGTVQYHYCDSREPLPQPQWSSGVAEGWTYSYGSNWTGEQNIQQVIVQWCRIGHRRVLITVTNNGGTTVRLGSDANVANIEGEPGEPALNIGGWPMISLPAHVEEYRNEESIEKYRSPRALALGSSEWRQTPGVLDPVARTLLRAMSDPVPVLEDLPVRGNPRVQVGQVARLTFRGEAMQPIVGVIIKTVRVLDGDGYTDRISVRPLPEQRLAPVGWTFYLDTSRYQWDTSTPINLARTKALGYGGLVAKIGQGAGSTSLANPQQTYGQTLDAYWEVSREQGRALWPDRFAGYWYVGNTETPASQASRCAAALGADNVRTIYGDERPAISRVRADGPYTLGTKFRVSAPSRVTALRFWRPDTSVGGTIRGCIYPEGSTTPVAGTTVTFSLSGTGWQYATLSTPVTLPAGRYRIAVLYPSRFPEIQYHWTRGAGSEGVRRETLTVDAASHTSVWVAGPNLAYPDRIGAYGETWMADVVIQNPVSQIPVMLDFEDGSGTWSNLLAVLDAFRAAGINTTMVYAGAGYTAATAGGGNPTNMDAAGLKVIRARYWTNDVAHPRVLFDDITDPAAFGLAPFNGSTPDAFQFTQYGLVYPGLSMDVDAFPGDERQLSDMFYNR